jgi:hypothetical protein
MNLMDLKQKSERVVASKKKFKKCAKNWHFTSSVLSKQW